MLVTANIHSSPIFVTLLMEEIHSSESSALTRATRRNTQKAVVFFKSVLCKILKFSGWGLWRMRSYGMLRHVTVVRTYVSEQRSASITRVTRISKLGITFLFSVLRFLVNANVVPSSPILVRWWWRPYVPPKRRLYQDPHGVASQKTAFFKNNLDVLKPRIIFTGQRGLSKLPISLIIQSNNPVQQSDFLGLFLLKLTWLWLAKLTETVVLPEWCDWCEWVSQWLGDRLVNLTCGLSLNPILK
jgi:hypothetical protein